VVVLDKRGDAFGMSNNESNIIDANERDRRLLTAFAVQQDAAAFESLIALYRDSVFDLARRILSDDSLADDVSQETFLALYRKPPALNSEGTLRYWLLGVARHYALKRRSVNSRRASRESNYAMKQSLKMPEPVESASIQASELRTALDSLPEEFQVPVALHYLHGLQRSEIAAMLKIPDGTADSRIARGLERLRMLLGGGKGRTASAALGVVALEASLKALPLAKAPGSIGALDIIQKLDTTKVVSESARHFSQLKPKAGSRVVPAVIFAAMVLVTGGLWKVAHTPSAMPKAATPAAASTQPTVPVVPARSYWNFDTAEQASVFDGDRSSIGFLADGGLNGSGCLRVDGNLRAKLHLPFKELPQVLTIGVYMGDLKPGQTNAWTFSWSGQPCIYCHVRNVILPENTKWITLKVYITEKSIDGWFQDQRIFLSLTEKAEPVLNVQCLSSGVLRLDDLQIRRADPVELPDIEPYIAAINAIPKNHRSDKTEVSVRLKQSTSNIIVHFSDLNDAKLETDK
jgi:RNA polymerase sigma-70 factor (ECF subfamily)